MRFIKSSQRLTGVSPMRGVRNRSADEQHAEKPTLGHQRRELQELVFPRRVRPTDERDGIATCRRGAVFAEELETGQIDEDVREQVRTFEEHARELRHDLAGFLGARRGQQGERAMQPPSREHGLVAVGRLAAIELGEAGIAHVRIDHADRGARQIDEREAELDDHRWHRDPGIRRDEPDDTQLLAVNPPCDARARGLELAGAIIADCDAQDVLVAHLRSI